jgi:hypothetical protein
MVASDLWQLVSPPILADNVPAVGMQRSNRQALPSLAGDRRYSGWQHAIIQSAFAEVILLRQVIGPENHYR